MSTMATGLNGAIGEKGGNVEGGLMDARLVGRVGIADIVGSEDNRLGVFTLDDDAGTEADSVVQPFVRDGDTVEVRLFVELYDTVLNDGIALNDERGLSETDGEAQGAFVKHLVVAEDVGHDNAVAKHQDQGRMGVRLGATASMVDEGLRLQLLPERPTIGYKEFNLNSDNFLLIGRNNRIQAKIDLIADDKTGVKLYTEDQDPNMLQDLTLSLYHIDLAELTSVLPYLPKLSGKLDGDYHIVMDQEERISVVSDMSIRNMVYEGSPIGNLSTELVYMQREDDGHAIEARLLLDDEEFGLLQGNLTPGATKKSPTNIDATFKMTRFPLSIANGFVTDQIIGLEGFGEGELTIKGTTSTPVVNGEVYLDSAYLVSVPYGVRMRFDNDPVRIVGSHLLLENFGLYAYNKEPLNLQGDINFSDLDHIRMDMRMRARNLQLINARQEPKSIAYGRAFVNFFANLNGPLDALKMRGRL